MPKGIHARGVCVTSTMAAALLFAPALQAEGAVPAESAAPTADAAPGVAVSGAPAPADTSNAPIPVAPTAGPADAAAAKNGSGATTQLEEIVVTATKRQERLRDIPESISVFTGGDLERQGKINLVDYLQETPGVTASQAADGQDRITMRGINTDASPVSPLASPVGVFIGDVPFTDSYIVGVTPDLSAFDLKDVEVLKGPQGTLFGGAALSGAIRYQLNDPVLGEWEGRGFSQYIAAGGGGEALTSGASVNVPLYRDKLAVRVAYVDRHLPGTVDDGYSGQKDVDKGGGNQVRAIALWQPLKALDIKLTHLSQTFSAANLEVPSSPTQRVNDITIMPAPVHNDFGMDALEFGYSFYDMRLISLSSRVTKHSNTRSDETYALIGPPPKGYPPVLGAVSSGISSDDSFNQEIRLQSTGNGPLKWLAGAYYNRYKMHLSLGIDTVLLDDLTGPGSIISTVAGALGIPSSALNNLQLLNGLSNAESQERALFGDVTYTLWQRLDLNAGVRLYRTSLDGGFLGSGLLVLAENNGQPSNTNSNLTQKGINPKFSATYHFSRDASLYAAAVKGFRFGGINDIPPTSTNKVPATYKSDTLWNYELGLRTDWFDRTLRADLTLFDIEYKNPIVAQSTQGLLGIAYTANVSAAVSRGVETSLLWKTPIRGLKLSLSGDIMNAHITQPFQSSTGETIPAGTELPGASHYQYTGGLQYLRPIGPVLVGFNTTYTYIGKGYTDIEHLEPNNGYGLLGAGFTFGSQYLPLHPSLAINVANILDETKVTASQHVTSIVTQERVGLYTLSLPRTVNARLSLEF